jgi:arylsulfatase A
MAGLFFLALFTAYISVKPNDMQNEFSRPNIIYILADDLGYGDIKVLNDQSKIESPNIDRIAHEGILFTDAHSASSVCTPSRYALLTGRYAWRSILKRNVLLGVDPALIESNRATVASFLKENGYHTAVVGKWHLGLDWVKKDASKPLYDGTNKWAVERTNIDYLQPVTNGPRTLGFDYSYIIPSSLDIMPYLYLENNIAVEPADSFTEGKSQTTFGRGIHWLPGEMSAGFVFEEVMPTFTRQAISYIHKRASIGEPFFLFFAMSAPHTPWLPTSTHSGQSGAGHYGDFVQQVDSSVGQILGALDEAGISDETLIIFTSDNGAHWTEKDKSKFDHRANGLLRGQKADIYEGGHRVPFLVRWPGHISSGTRSMQTISLSDLFATLAELLGEEIPQGAAEDSISIMPALLSRSSDRREATIHHSLDGMFAIRKGDWKLIEGLGSGGFTSPSRIKQIKGGSKGQLYNLAIDPAELVNLYESQPTMVAELESLLAMYRES